MDIVLNARNISLTQYGKPVLEHVDFYLMQGELLCIYGTYHSGINALSDILAGMVRPSAGRISYMGQQISLYSSPQHYVSRIGMESALVDHLTVAENLFVLSRKRSFPIRWNSMRETGARILEQILPSVHPGQYVYELDSLEKRVLEIIKFALMGTRIILIDNMIYFSENTNEMLYETIRTFCAKGMSFIYLGQTYDYFSEKADRILTLRNGHMAGFHRTFDGGEAVLKRMTAAFSAEDLPPETPVYSPRSEILMEYAIQTETGLFRGEIIENEIICFLSIPMICTRFGETFWALSSVRSSESDGGAAGISWKIRKKTAFRLGLIPYDYRKDLICPHLTVYENAFLNVKDMDIEARAIVNTDRHGYFSRQLDAFLGKPKGWTLENNASMLTFQEQRLVLLYRSLLCRHRIVVLLFPTGDVEKVIQILKQNQITVIVITDNVRFLKDSLDRLLEVRMKSGRYNIIRREL